jgi:hypothetical protein
MTVLLKQSTSADCISIFLLSLRNVFSTDQGQRLWYKQCDVSYGARSFLEAPPPQTRSFSRHLCCLQTQHSYIALQFFSLSLSSHIFLNATRQRFSQNTTCASPRNFSSIKRYPCKSKKDNYHYSSLFYTSTTFSTSISTSTVQHVFFFFSKQRQHKHFVCTTRISRSGLLIIRTPAPP